MRSRVWLAVMFVACALSAGAQQAPAVVHVPQVLPPATRLEGFAATPGSVLTIGYDRLGGIEGVFVEVRDMRDARGGSASGVVVTVTEEDGRSRQDAYVDADELPGLISGVDALMSVSRNPTSFDNYEVHYATRGDLLVSALSTRTGGVVYSVQAGRIERSLRTGITSGEMIKLRGIFDAAVQKLRNAAGR
jgi:hypothetical protein